ncbi:acetolactate decarboxylase [Lactococcus sp.]|uniref:acetolactate decarboxylase n=1 Tax=Lactococcus sp. TaxID=44273 RepID=UPI0035AE7216
MKTSKIFQHNSHTTLHGGFYEGTISAKEVLKHGLNGIGTLDGADGEVIILNGHVYHGSSENHVRLVSYDETMPYVAVVDHQVSVSFDSLDVTLSTLKAALLSRIENANVPYTVVISGQFKSVEISSKPAHNTAPYAEIMATQPHFTNEDVSGTIVGVWSPKHLESLYGDGFHLHFISDDRTFGAHLVDFEAKNVSVEFGMVGQMEQEFALESNQFNNINF